MKEKAQRWSKCWIGIRAIGANWTVRKRGYLSTWGWRPDTRRRLLPNGHSGEREQLMYPVGLYAPSGTLHSTVYKGWGEL